MSTPLEQKALLALRQYSLFTQGDRIAVGVSGGADSVALLRFLAVLREEYRWELIVCHIHHGLRGAEADRDEQFVRELAGQLGLPYAVRHIDAAALALENHLSVEEAGRYNRIILSPGPGIPSEAGILPEVVKRYAAEKSILGICLGEQAIGECFGAELENLPEVFHGICTPVRVIAEEKMFSGLGESFDVGRYHSWVVSRKNLPECLTVTAEDAAGRIMALSHKSYDVRGLQFHPESILTPMGKMMMANWLHA